MLGLRIRRVLGGAAKRSPILSVMWILEGLWGVVDGAGGEFGGWAFGSDGLGETARDVSLLVLMSF